MLYVSQDEQKTELLCLTTGNYYLTTGFINEIPNMNTARFLFLLILSFPLPTLAQKNVIDVTKSAATGISLPAGSKQD